MNQNKIDKKWQHEDELLHGVQDEKRAPETRRFHAKLKSSPRQGK